MEAPLLNESSISNTGDEIFIRGAEPISLGKRDLYFCENFLLGVS
jgi:hypothetical protein